MSDRIEAEVLYRPPLEELRFLPEGPYPCGQGKFSWVAIQHGADQAFGSLNIFDLQTRTNQSYLLPGRPGFAFACREPHRFVIGCERTLGLYDIHDGSWSSLSEGIDSGVSGTIINDGVTWNGNLIFGCKDLQFAEAKAGLYLWRGRDQKLIQLRNDQTCSNGKAILPTGDRKWALLDIDTPTKTLVRYEVDLGLGRLSEPQLVLDLRGVAAFPDGMIATPDQQSVIISFYNPNEAEYGETRQYRLADGALERTWITPGSPQVTCPQLIEYQGKIHLILTTAVEHMSEIRRTSSPEAGSLFIAPTDFRTNSDSPAFESSPDVS